MPTFTPIGSACKRTFRFVRSSGTRPTSAIKWIVVHSTETSPGSAKNVSSYFASSSAQASTHLVVDDYECYRGLDNYDVPWGAPGANYAGFHIEHVGYAKWTRAEWLSHSNTLRRGAYKTALHCLAWGIPLRWVGKYGLKLGRKGITTHKDCSDAFSGGDGHWDPGPNFPKDTYLSYVKQYAASIKAARSV